MIDARLVAEFLWTVFAFCRLVAEVMGWGVFLFCAGVVYNHLRHRRQREENRRLRNVREG